MLKLAERLHISWLITAANLGLLGGVALAKINPDLPVVPWLFIAMGISFIVLSFLSRIKLIVPIAVIGGILIGLVMGQETLTKAKQVDKYIGDEVKISGVMAEDVNANNRGYTIGLDNIELQIDGHWQPTVARIWVNVSKSNWEVVEKIKRGDKVILSGVLDSGFGVYRATLSDANIVKIIHQTNHPIIYLRDKFYHQLQRVMTQLEAGLGMGILAGEKIDLGTSIKNAFVAASLTHILVASGYNLTVLTRFSRRLFAKKSRWLAIFMSLVFIWAFAIITGSSASMNRAIIVAVISLLLWGVGRRIHPLALLSLTAAITVIADPTVLWGDVGWYLSFGSFAGVILLAPMLNDLIKKLPGQAVWQVLCETISAQAVTWPIIALFMGTVSLVGLITNVLVLLLLPLVMLLTFFAGIGAFILPPVLAKIVALPAAKLLDYVITVAKWGATLPGASVTFQPRTKTVVIYYVVLIIAGIVLKIATKHNFYGDNVVE